MNGNKEFQEKLMRYQILDNRVKGLMNRRDFLVNRVLEIESTLNSMEDVEKSKGDEIFLPLGSSVHAPGTLHKTKKMIVELGADIAIECTAEKAKVILENRKKTIEDGLQAVEGELVSLSNELVRLEPEIRSILEKKGSRELEAG
jgi:prefoldin alpha subunit